jgi:hypothetical protein
LQQFVDAANEHEEPFGRLNILEHAARFRPDFGMSQANALRVYCGGELPDVDDASALITSLLTAARDVYPLFLIPTPEGMPITGPTGAYSHPESEEFSRHALRDESLSRLFQVHHRPLGQLEEIWTPFTRISYGQTVKAADCSSIQYCQHYSKLLIACTY